MKKEKSPGYYGESDTAFLLCQSSRGENRMSNPGARPSSRSKRGAKTDGIHSGKKRSQEIEPFDRVALESAEPSSAPSEAGREKTTILHMVDCLNIGGGEMQMVDLVKRIDRRRFR